MDKVVKEIVKALDEQGFDVVETKSGRLMVYRDGVDRDDSQPPQGAGAVSTTAWRR
jgi:hypothetical protein